MATYSIWYTEAETYKGYFEAENAEAAKKLLHDLEDGFINFDDLPDWYSKGKDYSLNIAHETLEETN